MYLCGSAIRTASAQSKSGFVEFGEEFRMASLVFGEGYFVNSFKSGVLT